MNYNFIIIYKLKYLSLNNSKIYIINKMVSNKEFHLFEDMCK